ncbi:MAG: IS30 family transposase, partial [Hyphomicrobiales bacterium]|nr:IS30 family transposase [Hyphomicrobiales bacterium]
RRLVRREKLHRYLTRAKASRGRRYFKRRREPLPGRRSIHERSQDIDNRQVFGHWEGDLMQFRTQRGNLLTLVERQSRLVLAAPLPTKTAENTANSLAGVFSNLPAAARRSITFDNVLYSERTADLGTGSLPRRAIPTRLSVSRVQRVVNERSLP